MSNVWQVNGIAFRDRLMAIEYINKYKNFENAGTYSPVETDENKVNKVYSSLGEFEKSNPVSVIDRLRSEREVAKLNLQEEIKLPVKLTFYPSNHDYISFDFYALSNEQAYEFVKLAEKTIKEQQIDLKYDNFMFEVVVPDGLEAKLYNLSVSDYKAIKNAIKEKINKIGKLTVEIEKALKMYGVRDKEIMKENKAYKKFHEEFLKKLEKFYTDISSKNQELFNYMRERDRELS